MTNYRQIEIDGETFDIAITGNAPEFINEGVKQAAIMWLDKQGSTVYFTGEGPGIKGKKRKILLLKLKITRSMQHN